MNIQKIKSAVRYYKTYGNEDDASKLDLFSKIWEVQDELAKEMPKYQRPLDRQILELRDKDIPVFSEYPVDIAPEKLSAGCKKLADVLLENGNYSDDITDALNSLSWDELLAKAGDDTSGKDPVGFLERLSEELEEENLDEDVYTIIMFVVTMAQRAMLSSASDQLVIRMNPLFTHHRHKNNCPSCGAPAVLAKAAPENTSGGRHQTLWCGICDTHWEYERDRCVRCGSTDVEKLHYYDVEGDDVHRLALCDDCDDYIRMTYMDNTLLPFAFEVEDVMTTGLDEIAQDPDFEKQYNETPSEE
ncbi:MAG: formate dehydrogenase accessory protein FdhE [Eggerthellaceae bacterium]|nr:formate dehydrogenase accessory protein FdhE [Eggerthellaceae bacterium]